MVVADMQCAESIEIFLQGYVPKESVEEAELDLHAKALQAPRLSRSSHDLGTAQQFRALSIHPANYQHNGIL